MSPFRDLAIFTVLPFVFCLRPFLGAAEINGTSRPPNILFIAIDDMNDWTTLFDQSNPIQTPNLERLA